ncbi:MULTISPECIES: hypothetical protein [unclassified Bradyrhizobium]|uniref:hypothetical protein n=1 Tax=unclassified Bradyrhizobium TaxID=2631580 RepID=UPI00211ECF67|nr:MULTISPECIES: hypothetical protein [unclassified Bradyrhizobium]
MSDAAPIRTHIVNRFQRRPSAFDSLACRRWTKGSAACLPSTSRSISEVGERATGDGRQFIKSCRTGAGRLKQRCGNELPALMIAAMPDVTERRVKRRIQDGLHAAFEFIHSVNDLAAAPALGLMRRRGQAVCAQVNAGAIEGEPYEGVRTMPALAAYRQAPRNLTMEIGRANLYPHGLFLRRATKNCGFSPLGGPPFFA